MKAPGVSCVDGACLHAQTYGYRKESMVRSAFRSEEGEDHDAFDDAKGRRYGCDPACRRKRISETPSGEHGVRARSGDHGDLH